MVLGAAAVVIGLTIVAVRIVTPASNGCGRGIRLAVAAAPEIAPAIGQVTSGWSSAGPRVNGQCVRVQVNATAPADVANMLSVRAGSPVSLGATPAPTPNESDVPAVWIPDSVSWLARVQQARRDLFDQDTPSVAMSPVVLAMPAQTAATLPQPPHPMNRAEVGALVGRSLRGELKVRVSLSDPRRDAVSLAGAALLRDAVVTNSSQLPALVAAYRGVALVPDRAGVLRDVAAGKAIAPLTEQAIVSQHPGGASPVAALGVDTPASLDYPYAIVSGQPRAITQAAELLRTELTRPEHRDVFARAGFRSPDGSVGAAFAGGIAAAIDTPPATPLSDSERISDVLGVWSASMTPSRVLTLADVTSSMGQPVTLPTGQVTTRMQILQKAAIDGLRLFTDDSELGLWAFAAGLPGGTSAGELVPLGRLDAAQRAHLNAAVDGAAPVPTNACGLYDAVLTAYRAMKAGYREGMSNTIVVFTDGRNTVPGLDLDGLKLELERLTDTTRPIRVVLLGIGPDVDIAELTAIAKTTGGKAFTVQRPEDIAAIFLDALLRTAI